MDINDQELFEQSLGSDDGATGQVAEQAEASVAETGTEAAQPRDENGRFAARQTEQAQAQPEGQAAQAEQPAGEDAQVPSWRMRELREERDAALRRSQEIEQRLMRQIAELQSQMPKQEPQSAPDVFEDPNRFLEHGVSQAINPIKSEMVQLREFYSRREAVREFGQEKVDAAYKAIAEGMQSRDPEVLATYQRAMQSMDPFEEIVRWHQQKSVYQQIGNDPNAWFEKQIEERMKDPTFAGALLAKIQGTATGNQSNGSVKPIVKLPPSLNKVASAQGATAEDGDMSDEALFAHAMR